ncbi:MAG: polyphosphate polymerase domain-containing protein [Bacillota bacterium]
MRKDQTRRSYRHELKFYITAGDYALLSRRLSRCMDRDKNADEYGNYFIRSLYFDDLEDSAFREKLDGVDSRDKYRIRIYNLSDDVIKLERKHKEGQYILKESASLSRKECDLLISGDPSFLLRRDDLFSKQMYARFVTRRLLPRVIVDYTREAYIYPYEDVRVTFDKQVKTGFRAVDIFDGGFPTYPALDGYGTVLEIKFNRNLPLHIRALLQIDSHARSAISKYCLCRRYEL